MLVCIEVDTLARKSHIMFKLDFYGYRRTKSVSSEANHLYYQIVEIYQFLLILIFNKKM